MLGKRNSHQFFNDENMLFFEPITGLMIASQWDVMFFTVSIRWHFVCEGRGRREGDRRWGDDETEGAGWHFTICASFNSL